MLLVGYLLAALVSKFIEAFDESLAEIENAFAGRVLDADWRPVLAEGFPPDQIAAWRRWYGAETLGLN
jgi:hypothetical protein